MENRSVGIRGEEGRERRGGREELHKENPLVMAVLYMDCGGDYMNLHMG